MKLDLAVNNLQMLIRHKTQTTINLLKPGALRFAAMFELPKNKIVWQDLCNFRFKPITNNALFTLMIKK